MELQPLLGITSNEYTVQKPTMARNVYATRIKISNTEVINLYKPPSQRWSDSIISSIENPAVIMLDFNYRNTLVIQRHQRRW